MVIAPEDEDPEDGSAGSYSLRPPTEGEDFTLQELSRSASAVGVQDYLSGATDDPSQSCDLQTGRL